MLLDTKKKAGVRVLDVTQSNPTAAGLEYPDASVLVAMFAMGTNRYEPCAAGLWEAREAVAEYYAAHGVRADPGRIFLTASTSEAYSFLFKLLADPGAEALVPRPSYPLFDYVAALDGVEAVPYPLVYEGGWRIDLDALREAVTPNSRAVIAVNPNNPTGSFVKREEARQMAALCGEHGLALISDEVFADYAFAEDPERAGTLAGTMDVKAGALTFCLSGLSKVAGMPHMKLGWILVCGPEELCRQACERLELIADTYLSVGTPVQHAARGLLEAGAGIRKQIAARVRGNLNVLRATVAGQPSCRALAVEGGWYAILEVPRTRSEEEWCLELLERDDVLAQPGYFYDFEREAYLVVSLLTEPGIFTEGIRRLLARA
jgi:alanine-synthesizing transaminase